MNEIEALREENERLKLIISGKTFSSDTESYKAGMLAGAEIVREIDNNYWYKNQSILCAAIIDKILTRSAEL